MGVDRIKYPVNISTPTSALTTAKQIHQWHHLHAPVQVHVWQPQKNYLGTLLDCYEYIRLSIQILPQPIIDAYNLLGLVHNGYVYCEIQRDMYGLPQVGKLAYNQLVRQLDSHGYALCRHTPGLWRHKWRPILFYLVIEKFGVEYFGQAHGKHLVMTLRKYHTHITDWEGTLYCGITLKWGYTCHTVNLRITGYINVTLQKYQHPEPRKPHHAPYQWEKPQYVQTTHYIKPTVNSPKIDAVCIKQIQKSSGHYYTTPAPWETPCWCQSMQYQRHREMAQPP